MNDVQKTADESHTKAALFIVGKKEKEGVYARMRLFYL
jgi:hypothetical protein